MKRPILLNPGPVTTTNTVKQALIVDDICHREAEFTQLVQSIRHDLLNVANANDDYTAILFTASGTGALEATLSSVIQNDDTIAILNNGSYGERLIKIATRYGLNVISIDQPYDQAVDLTAIDKVLSEHDISHLAIVHHETSIGTLNPLHAISELCQKHECQFIVDAMSSFAGVPLSMVDDHIDYLISSSNKCLHGMPGLSFVIANKARLEACEGTARSLYFDLHQQYRALERGGEMPFTPAIQVAYAFKQALKEYLDKGAQQHQKQFADNYQTLRHGLERMGFKIMTPNDCQSGLLMTVQMPDNVQNNDFDHLHDSLYAKGYTIYPKKLPIDNSFRLSCIGDLSQDDIEQFLTELDAVIH